MRDYEQQESARDAVLSEANVMRLRPFTGELALLECKKFERIGDVGERIRRETLPST